MEATTDEAPAGFIQQLLAKNGGGKTLKRISFNRAPHKATDEDLQLVAVCAALEELDLDTINTKTWTGDDGKRAFENRNIGAPEISDEGMAHVARLPRLRFITLSQSKVTDRTCQLLAGSKSLQTIGLDGARISDQGLFDLAKIPSLKFISVRAATATEAGVAKFQLMRPDVEVLSNYRK